MRRKDPQGNSYLVHIDDQSFAVKILSDPEIDKTVHLHVSKEKASDDIPPPSNRNDVAPSNHPNGRALLLDGGVSTEGAEQLTVRRPQSISLSLKPELEFRLAYQVFVFTVIIIGIKDVLAVCRTVA
jgi:hypothetical protein